MDLSNDVVTVYSPPKKSNLFEWFRFYRREIKLDKSLQRLKTQKNLPAGVKGDWSLNSWFIAKALRSFCVEESDSFCDC